MIDCCNEKYDIEYNGDTGERHGILLYDYPVISPGKKNYESYTVPGKNGEIVSASEYLSNANISCTFSVLHRSLMPKIRSLKQWLKKSGILKLSDSPDIFYEVLKVEYGDLERELRNFGKFTVNFICYPYEFSEDGKRPVSEPLYNPYDCCMPIYDISGEGVCTLTVNGKSVIVNVGQNVKIDTRRQIAFRSNGEMENTSVKGNYEDLWIPHGEFKVQITEGFSLSTIPRWGYDL